MMDPLVITFIRNDSYKVLSDPHSHSVAMVAPLLWVACNAVYPLLRESTYGMGGISRLDMSALMAGINTITISTRALQSWFGAWAGHCL